jgi:hypothetical protein
MFESSEACKIASLPTQWRMNLGIVTVRTNQTPLDLLILLTNVHLNISDTEVIFGESVKTILSC